ncbi:MAG: acyl-ACP thioesterase [bacterium]|nr:MAG: acyl-ACP thioesterase [bacterium]
MTPIYQLAYEVRPHEAGYMERARPAALLNYLQDAAFGHAAELGVSVFDLFPKGLTWVLSRYHIVIDRYPLVGEKVAVRTWIPARHGHFFPREFEITDDEGNVLLCATTSWLLLDLKTKRPVPDDGSIDALPVLERRAVVDDFDPLPELVEQEGQSRFTVRLSDVDVNRHVNHVAYIQWALESVPNAASANRSPVRIEASYLGEAHYGDSVIARIGRSNDRRSYVHQLIGEKDGRELTRLRTAWEPVRAPLIPYGAP